MSRLEITAPDKAQLVIEGLYKDLERRIESSPPGLCPVDMTRAFLEMCHTHTCGKCVPCRIGLWQLKNLLTDVLNGDATMETLDLMEELALSIMEGADCAIGYEAAHMVYKSLMGCREDYEEHVRQGRCTCQYAQPVPCVSLCPAHVDIPGYIALVGEGRYADAIRLIRKDNPFPTTCDLSVNILVRHAAVVISWMMQSISADLREWLRIMPERFHLRHVLHLPESASLS